MRVVRARQDEAFWGGGWRGAEVRRSECSGAARRLLPRMVLALLELVAEARFPKQQSLRNKHKHLNKMGGIGEGLSFLLGWKGLKNPRLKKK